MGFVGKEIRISLVNCSQMAFVHLLIFGTQIARKELTAGTIAAFRSATRVFLLSSIGLQVRLSAQHSLRCAICRTQCRLMNASTLTVCSRVV